MIMGDILMIELLVEYISLASMFPFTCSQINRKVSSTFEPFLALTSKKLTLLSGYENL